MFGKKKVSSEIDKEQLELVDTAHKRIKQKKRLYIHFVVFLIGSLLIIIANLFLGIGKGQRLFEIDWFVYAILFWFAILLYHIFNVFVTNKFLGKAWEQKQLEKLVLKQKQRIEQLKSKLTKDEDFFSVKQIEEAEAPGQVLKKRELTIIVAAAENNAIGKDNTLIWHLGDDLKRFKILTNGHFIIMGRKTFESFPKPLPNRTHVVVTRQSDYKVPDGVIVVNNLEDAIDASKEDDNPFIIGGGEIYKQAIAVADKIELTRVHENFEADAFFPEIDTSIWKESTNKFHTKDANHNHEFSFITYVRK